MICRPNIEFNDGTAPIVEQTWPIRQLHIADRFARAVLARNKGSYEIETWCKAHGRWETLGNCSDCGDVLECADDDTHRYECVDVKECNCPYRDCSHTTGVPAQGPI